MAVGCKKGFVFTLTILAVVLIGAISPLNAQTTTVTTAAGTVNWFESINYLTEVTLVRGSTTHGDGYDGAMFVSVSGSGVTSSMDYTYSSTYGTVIQEVAVTNTSGSVTTYSITSSGNLGSDGSTYWHYASASGSYYTVSSDQSSPSTDAGDPVISFMYGDASLDVYSTSLPYSNGNDTHSFTASGVSIDPGQTQRWLFLGGVGDIDDSTYNRPDQAVNAVTYLMDPSNWPSDFLSGLTEAERGEVINWDNVIPTVTTTAVTSITSTSASSGGNVTDSGDSTVTARGVCWNTTGSPTISDSFTTDGSGTGSFTSSITGLLPDTTYYVRAYATNEDGTGYGGQVSFTTLGAEMDLLQGAAPIADGGTYSFGNRAAGSNTDVVFTIANSGGANLSLSGSPIISITGADAGLFSVQAQPAATVAPSGSTTFTIRFSPFIAGARTASIAIASNDSNENPYNLTLTGTGIAGTLNYIKVRDASGGGGSEVTTHSLTSDDTYTVYAAGYDQYDNYIADQSVSWSGSGVINGNLSPAIGTSTVFTAAGTGIGTITADHATATDDSTGTITVSPGAAASFDVTTEHSGTETAGTPFSVTLTAWDADGNIATGYTGAHSVAWTWTATSSPRGVAPTKPADGNQTFALGTVTVSGFTLTNSGETPTITATADVSGTSGAITINDGVLANVTIEDAAGAFINEPGSQLVYLLDTGVNAEDQYGTDVDYTSNSVLQYGHEAPVHQNFISITNTNPEQAVTVHFRYFNSDCVDFFDFLVVLTCNDTMMIDPFDFTVPGTEGVNVKDRFFGYPNRADGNGQSFDAIPASTFADGRFLLFVTASADVKTGFAPSWDEGRLDPDYDHLDLVPYEFINYREEELNVHCSAWAEGGGGDAGEELHGSYPVYGDINGFSDDNLHILNASAISFNYLVGMQTVAKVTDLGSQAAYMTESYARPAVFADGPEGAAAMPAPLHVLLTGGERIWTEAAGTGELITSVAGDQFMLRHEAHAGDQWDRGEDSLGLNWIISEGGALSWEVFPSSAMPAGNQVVNFISFMDNYNGESNLAQGAVPSVWDDVSYNIQPVVTIYTIEPFNNSEDPWIPRDPDDQPIVSPVSPESSLVTAIGVKCINAYEIDPESNLNDAVLGYKFGEFTLQDLFDMNAVVGTDSMTLEGFLNVLAGSANELENEVGPGWMRLSRWFTTRKWTTTQLTPEYVYSYWQGWDDSTEAPYELDGPTIFTAGQANFVFENFGAGKWLSTVNSE